MPVDCCGKPRSSRFCPDCGTRLVEDDPLGWLLDNCKAQEKGNRTRAETWRAQADGEMPDGWRKDPAGWRRLCAERAGECDVKADTWKARGDALAALMGTPGDSPPGA